jgi:hypothetical protein
MLIGRPAASAFDTNRKKKKKKHIDKATTPDPSLPSIDWLLD